MVLKVIGDSAGSSRMLQVRGPMMVKGDYRAATMKLDVWQKDMAIIAEFARRLVCPTPLFAASAPIYAAALASGPSNGGYRGCAVLEGMAGWARRRRSSSKFKVRRRARRARRRRG